MGMLFGGLSTDGISSPRLGRRRRNLPPFRTITQHYVSIVVAAEAASFVLGLFVFIFASTHSSIEHLAARSRFMILPPTVRGLGKCGFPLQQLDHHTTGGWLQQSLGILPGHPSRPRVQDLQIRATRASEKGGGWLSACVRETD